MTALNAALTWSGTLAATRLRLSHPVSIRVHNGSVWKTALKVYGCNFAGQWRVVDRAFGWDTTWNEWNETYIRTPAAPSSVTYSAPTDVSISLFTGEATWTVPAAESHLPVVVRFYKDGVVQQTQQNPSQPATYQFSITPGTAVTTWATVKIRNSRIEGPEAAGSPINTTYLLPEVTGVSVTPDYDLDVLEVMWGAINPPPGGYYGISFTDDYLHPTPVSIGTTTSLAADITALYHGYDLQEFAADNVLVEFTVTVTMFDASNAVVASNFGTVQVLVGL